MSRIESRATLQPNEVPVAQTRGYHVILSGVEHSEGSLNGTRYDHEADCIARGGFLRKILRFAQDDREYHFVRLKCYPNVNYPEKHFTLRKP
jgi:hypothetical protein